MDGRASRNAPVRSQLGVRLVEIESRTTIKITHADLIDILRAHVRAFGIKGLPADAKMISVDWSDAPTDLTVSFIVQPKQPKARHK